MALSDLKALLTRAGADPELRRRLNAADADPLTIAAGLGLTVTADDLLRLRGMNDGELEDGFAEVLELSDAELAGVSGGGGSTQPQLRQSLEAQCGSCWAFSVGG